jgi:hypothetical protein
MNSTPPLDGKPVESKASAAGTKPGMERITKDFIVDGEWAVVTDAATTFKYVTNRKQCMEMYFCEDGKGLIIDSCANAFTI